MGLALLVALVVLLAGCSGQGQSVPDSSLANQSTPSGSAPQATVSSPSGQVLVARDASDAWVEAEPGMRLGAGDSVRTGEDGSVLLLLFEGSVVEVGANSELLVGELTLDEAGSTGVRLRQMVGTTVNRVHRLVDPASRYEVETPAGIAAVRGTVFRANVDSSGYTAVGCEEGDVWFTAGGITVLLSGGMWSGASPGGPPSAPASGTAPTPSPVPDPGFLVENVRLCSEVRDDGDCVPQPDGVFHPGQDVWISFEVTGFELRGVSGAFEAWFRVSSACVYEPGGGLYLSGTDVVDFHETGLVEAPSHLWGVLYFELLPDQPAGAYQAELMIEDVFSGSTQPLLVDFTVEG